MAPKVSVVMSVRNGEPYLGGAIDSILDQTFGDFEFIIVDDGSTDRTWRMLTRYVLDDPRLVLLRNLEGVGLTKSLNYALTRARGEFIARQDADDLSQSQRFERQVSYLESHPTVGLLGTRYDYVDDNGRSILPANPPMENQELQRRLLQSNCICHGTAMFRRTCLDRVGGYRDIFKMAQDYDLWLRIAEHWQLANLPDSLYRYRFSARAISIKRLELQMSYGQLARDLCSMRRELGEEQLPMADNLRSCLQWLPSPDPRELAQRFLWQANLFHLAGDDDSAKSRFAAAVASELTSGTDDSPLYDWLIGYANAVATRKDSNRHGAQLISTMASGPRNQNLGLRKIRKIALGKFYVSAAFASYSLGEMNMVRRYVATALRHDRRWLRNRGLLSIGAEAFLGGWLTGLIRRVTAAKVWERLATTAQE